MSALCTPIKITFFFFNDTATTEIYTLSLHDALPISLQPQCLGASQELGGLLGADRSEPLPLPSRSEEHTSELQSRPHLVCRLLLEKKKDPMSDSLQTKTSSHVEIPRHHVALSNVYTC